MEQINIDLFKDINIDLDLDINKEVFEKEQIGDFSDDFDLDLCKKLLLDDNIDFNRKIESKTKIETIEDDSSDSLSRRSKRKIKHTEKKEEYDDEEEYFYQKYKKNRKSLNDDKDIKINTFIQKLFNVCNDIELNHIIDFYEKGGIIIYDLNEFSEKILKNNFKDILMNSFNRMLNIYGFSKNTNNLDNKKSVIFKNSFFRKNDENGLIEMMLYRRNIATKNEKDDSSFSCKNTSLSVSFENKKDKELLEEKDIFNCKSRKDNLFLQKIEVIQNKLNKLKLLYFQKNKIIDKKDLFDKLVKIEKKIDE